MWKKLHSDTQSNYSQSLLELQEYILIYTKVSIILHKISHSNVHQRQLLCG